MITRQAPNGDLEALVIIDALNVTGAYLVQAQSGFGDQGSEVAFTLNAAGGRLFGSLTGNHTPGERNVDRHRLAIVLDNVLLSAPGLESRITNRGRITGIRDQREIEAVVNILNAGSLPTALNPDPLSENVISPTLGADTIAAGQRSLMIATALVLLFMLVYYQFAGVVACIVLVLNLVLVLALMVTIKAAFTLPGLAGLVLTVGMAVDANVLIYERIREELNKGAALRMAIRNGFDQATRTIIDANITTLIVATVLYAIGTDQIKGFAVTLWLGIALSMFTAIFVARLIFEVAERKRWISDLRMLRLLSRTSIDFVKMAPGFITLSIVLIALGLGCLFMRGQDVLDIDFTGGSSVHALFQEPTDIGEVRTKLAESEDFDSVTVYGVDEAGREFKIDSANPRHPPDLVKEKITDIFGDALTRNQMTVGETSPIGDQASLSRPVGWSPLLAAVALGDQDDSNQDVEDQEVTDAGEDDSEEPAQDNSAEGDDATDQDAAPEATDQETPEPEDTPSTEESEEPAEGEEGEEAGTPDEQPAPQTSDPGETSTPEASGATLSPANLFAGGTRVDLTFSEQLNHSSLSARINESFAAAGVPEVNYRLSNDDYVPGSGAPYNAWTLEIAADADQTQQLLAALQGELAEQPVFPSSNSIGAAVAGDTQVQAFQALAVSLLGIILYIWFRFQNLSWGLASVAALVHDVAMMLGFIAASAFVAGALAFLLIEPFKISLTTVAAFLTIVGYSINDTIVIFDRMRDVKGKSPELTRKMVNESLNQTLARTVITSLTVFLVAVPLYILGGQAIHGFAFSLLIGVIFGSYSSLFIAAPLVLWTVGKEDQPVE